MVQLHDIIQVLFKWYDEHLHALVLMINDNRFYLWRDVDQDGNVLDILVQSRRNKKAVKKFFRKLLKGLTYMPRVIITDKLKSYGAAKRESMPGVEHRQSRYLNNRCENSHLVTLNVSFRPTVPSPNISDLDAIVILHLTTVKR